MHQMKLKKEARIATPKLDCQYMLEFKNLVSFLKNLLKAKFVFSEDLLVK
jgi:hypothetical protein